MIRITIEHEQPDPYGFKDKAMVESETAVEYYDVLRLFIQCMNGIGFYTPEEVEEFLE
jgi:hypothetical protein